jgi:hypothetical protein
MPPAAAKTDLPTPYTGQLVHYVGRTDNKCHPVIITELLKIDGETPADPIQFNWLDRNAATPQPQTLGFQRSDDRLMGTWHEPTAECPQVYTEVETAPSSSRS